MPGPVLSDNGENVLSSIRRLVSRAPGDGPSADPAPDEAEPLVLTPAQRVDGPAVDETGPPSEADAQDVVSRRTETDPAPSVEQAGVGDTGALDWQDRDEASESGQTVDGVDPRGEQNAPTLRDGGADGRALDLVDDTARADDAALRDLVAEIVREELSGEMGDRITRNVRKLVRREIHRVLSGRKLD